MIRRWQAGANVQCIVGPPGTGKSRIAGQFFAAIAGTGSETPIEIDASIGRGFNIHTLFYMNLRAHKIGSFRFSLGHDHHYKYQPKMPLLPIFSSSTHVSSLVNILFESLHFILYVTYSILFLGQNVQKYLDVHHAQPLGTTICFIVEPGSYM